MSVNNDYSPGHVSFGQEAEEMLFRNVEGIKVELLYAEKGTYTAGELQNIAKRLRTMLDSVVEFVNFIDDAQSQRNFSPSRDEKDRREKLVICCETLKELNIQVWELRTPQGGNNGHNNNNANNAHNNNGHPAHEGENVQNNGNTMPVSELESAKEHLLTALVDSQGDPGIYEYYNILNTILEVSEIKDSSRRNIELGKICTNRKLLRRWQRVLHTDKTRGCPYLALTEELLRIVNGISYNPNTDRYNFGIANEDVESILR